jgi:PAS domain S-box-containing protein
MLDRSQSVSEQAAYFLLPYAAAFLVSCGLCAYSWRRRSVAAARELALVAAGEAGWVFGNIFELRATSLSGKILWDDLQFIGTFVVLAGYVLFAAALTGYRSRRLRRVWVIPLVMMPVIFMDRFFHLVRSGAYVEPGKPFGELAYGFAPGFALIFAYIYVTVIAALYLLARYMRRARSPYRAQAVIAFVSMALPTVIVTLTVLGVVPTFHRDTSALAFTLGNVILAWGLFRYRLIDLAPVARDLVVEHMPDSFVVLDTEGRIVDVNQTALDRLNCSRSQVIGRSAEEVYGAWPDLLARFRNLETAHEEVTAEVDGQQRSYDLRLSTIYDPHGTAIGRLLVARDITQRKQMEIAEQEQRRVAEALAEIAAVLNGTLDMETVLDLILDNLGSVVPHDAAAIMFLENGVARIVRSRSALSTRRETMVGQGFPLETTRNLRLMAETRQPCMIADVTADPHWVPVLGMEWLGSYAGAPIISDNQVVGFLDVESRKKDFYTPYHARWLQAFAHQSATAIRNAHVFQQGQVLAALQERQRLARDLHDAVSQSLFSASITAEMLLRLWELDPPKVRAGLAQLRDLTRGAQAEMRSLLLELRPEALEVTSLKELLNQIVVAFVGRSGIETQLDADEVSGLPSTVKTAFYRVAQEALNNVSKHARATQVSVRLRRVENRIELHIADNGFGFDPHSTPLNRLGLSNIRERADSIGAALTLESGPGQGTQLRLVYQHGPEGPDDDGFSHPGDDRGRSDHGAARPGAAR